MARIITTSGAEFTPFSYDELVKPLAQMAEAHAKTQENYDTLQAATSALGRYISQEGADDAQARDMYNRYQELLANAQNELWNNGYGAGAMRALSKARAGYAQDITRLDAAIKARQEAAKAWFDAGQKDPTLLQSANPGSAGLDNYLNDDTYGYKWKSYSGELLKEQIGKEAAAVADQFLSSPEAQAVLGTDQYLAIRQHGGFFDWQVRAAGEAYRNGAGRDSLKDAGSQVLYDILSRQMESSGIKGWADEGTWNRAVDYGISGLMNGVGKTSDSIQSNGEYLSKKERISIALQSMKAAGSGSGGRGSGSGSDGDKQYWPDTWSPEFRGKDYKKGLQYHDKYFGPMPKTIVLPDGTRVTSREQATNLMYSTALREKTRGQIGIDIGGDDGKDINIDGSDGWALTPQSRFLTGSTYIEGLGQIDTRYNPRTKKVEYKKPNESWSSARSSNRMTAIYDNAVREYKDNKRRYRDLLGDYAISPYAESQMRKFANVGDDVPLSELDRELTSSKDTGYRRTTFVNLADEATSKEMVDIFASKLMPSIAKYKKNKIALGRETNTVPDSTQGIREVNAHTGTLKRNQVKNYADVFKLDDKGNINNISRIMVSPESARDNCVIVMTRDGKLWSVNVNMFNSGELQNYFDNAVHNLGLVPDMFSDPAHINGVSTDIMRGLSTQAAQQYNVNEDVDKQASTTKYGY